MDNFQHHNYGIVRACWAHGVLSLSRRITFFALCFTTLVVGALLLVEYVPNPVLKPSVVVDAAVLDMQYNYLLVFFSLHNPTHTKYDLEVSRISMSLQFEAAGKQQTTSRTVGYFWGGFQCDDFGCSDIAIASVTLDPCTPVGEVASFDLPQLTNVEQATANIQMSYTANRQQVTSSNRVTVLVNPTFPQTTTTTSTTTSAVPNECLLPWNLVTN